MDKFKQKIQALPLGSFYCIYRDSKYIVIKQLYSEGKIIKLYAKELKGRDIVSGNYFLSIQGGLLKPCEMSDAKVIDFVNHLMVM
jgi:peptide-methionine (S)-S-oxide reductase